MALQKCVKILEKNVDVDDTYVFSLFFFFLFLHLTPESLSISLALAVITFLSCAHTELSLTYSKTTKFAKLNTYGIINTVPTVLLFLWLHWWAEN